MTLLAAVLVTGAVLVVASDFVVVSDFVVADGAALAVSVREKAPVATAFLNSSVN